MSGSEGMKEGDRKKNPASLSRVSLRAHSSCFLSACYALGTALGTALSHFTLTSVLPILQIWKRARRSYGTCPRSHSQEWQSQDWPFLNQRHIQATDPTSPHPGPRAEPAHVTPQARRAEPGAAAAHGQATFSIKGNFLELHWGRRDNLSREGGPGRVRCPPGSTQS